MDARLGFFEIEALRHARSGRPYSRWRSGLLRRFHLGGCACSIGLCGTGVARGALRQSNCSLLLPEFECSARAFAAAQQPRIVDASARRAVELGKQSATWVGSDGGNRSDPRTEAEAVQGDGGCGFRVKCHASSCWPTHIRLEQESNVRADIDNSAALCLSGP